MRHASIITIAAILVAGCHKSSIEEKNASVGDVAQAVAAAGNAAHFTPGRWETSVRVTRIDAPGLPSKAADGMRAAMARTRVIATCLTPEQAAHPEQNMFNRDVKNCRYDHFTMGGGRIDAALHCDSPAGPAAPGGSSVTMKGNYDPAHYSMTMTTQAEQGPVGRMAIDMAMESHLAGVCRGDEMHGS